MEKKESKAQERKEHLAMKIVEKAKGGKGFSKLGKKFAKMTGRDEETGRKVGKSLY